MDSDIHLEYAMFRFVLVHSAVRLLILNNFCDAGRNGSLKKSLDPYLHSVNRIQLTMQNVLGGQASTTGYEKCCSLTAKLSWLNFCENRKIFRRSGTQSSSDKAQGVIMQFFDEVSINTTTPDWSRSAL